MLVAEQLFASGCRFLISIASAGQLIELAPPPYFILIEKALRDEGTSYHYQPPSEFSHADASLQRMIAAAISDLGVPIVAGATWTTDAPYRETEEAIAAMTAKGLLAVEMEAAALYAFAAARQKPVLCNCSCHQPDGACRRRLRKGRSKWQPGLARHHPRSGRRIPQGVR